jgi:head-tail adaptor
MPISSGLLIEAFTPQTLTETADGQGGTTSAWADGTAFRGRLSSLPINEQLNADKTTVFASHKLYCNNQTITEVSRIRNSDSTRYFEIKGIVNPSNANSHLEILLLEVK